MTWIRSKLLHWLEPLWKKRCRAPLLKGLRWNFDAFLGQVLHLAATKMFFQGFFFLSPLSSKNKLELMGNVVTECNITYVSNKHALDSEVEERSWVNTRSIVKPCSCVAGREKLSAQLQTEASASQIASASVSCPLYRPGQTRPLLDPPPP